MINFDEIKRQMLPIINSEDVYVILDVDRTIINGTSWYYACKYADLLISKKNIKDFIRFNDMAYGENSLSLESFREKTLNLITSTYSKEFIKLMKSVREVDYTFKEGLEIDQLKLYFSGIFISRELTVYSDVVRYIKYMHRFFGSRLKLIFLSSGYQEFIRGVVDGIFKNNFDEKIDYSVIGSEVDIINGKLREVYFMSQKNKQKIVEALIENGANIELLADDSSENPELFECVLNNGGKALQIDYAKGQSLSKVWSEFCKSFDSNSLKNHLMFEDIRNKICKVNMKNDYMDFLSNKTNEIGIFTLTYGEYVEALCYLLDSINLEKGNEIESLLSQMFMIKNDVVHLRGKLYYYWVPQYVFLDTRDIIEGYLELLRAVKKLLGELSECKLIDRHINNYYVRTIMISILEHLQHALLICLNTIELASISEESTPVVDFGLRDIIQLTTDLIFGCIEGNSINEDVYNLIQSLNEDILVRWMNDYKMYHKGMRELDNIVSIYKSVKSIIDNERFNSIDYVISFAYGGISLGYSLVSYLKVNNVRKLFPIIINCHYSSKKQQRDNKSEPIYNDGDWLYRYIPQYYNEHIENIKTNHCRILLYDNNSTTLNTLEKCKLYLKQFSNEVLCAVVAFNYDNLCQYLSQEQISETMSLYWYNILDFNPVEEYVSAFNTWNSSRKSKIIEDTYFEFDSSKYNVVEFNSLIRHGKIFKLCRVHNIVDLDMAIRNGVNMIGIHAVNTDHVRYLINEDIHVPLKVTTHIDKNLPVSIYEINSIRKLIENINDSVQIALVLEKKMCEEKINTCLNYYGMSNKDILLQLQYRVNKAHIRNIKDKITSRIICTIGLNQMDFYEYFNKLDNSLDPKTDFILLDMSKHQPDFINGIFNGEENLSNIIKLKSIVKGLRNNKVPILVADDTTVSQMREYLVELSNNNVLVAGIDMQNAVELEKSNQKYQIVETLGSKYQIKIRKSPDKLKEWYDFSYNELRNY